MKYFGLKGWLERPPEPPVDPPLFQALSWENCVQGNALPMRNGGLQSNMCSSSGHSLLYYFFKNACRMLVMSTLKGSLDIDIFSEAVRICS